MRPNDADGMANSVDPDQTAPSGEVWSRSVLFVQKKSSCQLLAKECALSIGKTA